MKILDEYIVMEKGSFRKVFRVAGNKYFMQNIQGNRFEEISFDYFIGLTKNT